MGGRRRGGAALAAALACVAAILASGALGCGGAAEGDLPATAAREGNRARSEERGKGGGREGARAQLPVEVAEARRQRVEDAITGTGTIEAIQSIELRPEVEGRIVEILFREGTLVEAGEGLFKVDDSELRAQVARAEANRDLADATLRRTRQLIQGQGATQSDLEQAEATARSTAAELQLLRLRLDRTTVRAPFAGVTGARMVSLGDFVNSQTRLVSLQTVSPQRATLNVPERYAEQLRVGQTVSFRVGALRNREFSGVVDFVDPIVRQPGRTILVKARVANPRRELQPGMFVEGRLIAAARDNAVVVPEDAILPLQGAALVYVVRDGVANRRQVVTGLRTPGFVEIVSGVEAGEQVVVGGLERLTEGAAVRATVVDRSGGADLGVAPVPARR